MLTRTEAINQVLAGSGEQAVLTLTEGGSEVTNATAALDYATKRVLAKGWSFNRDEGYELTPATDGRIAVPSNALRIDPSDPSQRLVQRGGYVYDSANLTFVIGVAVEFDIVRAFDFEDVPFDIQQLIVAEARLRYQRDYTGSSARDAANQDIHEGATADAASAEDDVADGSVLDSPDLAPYLRRATYYRGRL